MICPKCCSSEHSIRLANLTTNLRTKKSQNRMECDNCGFNWKLE